MTISKEGLRNALYASVDRFVDSVDNKRGESDVTWNGVIEGDTELFVNYFQFRQYANSDEKDAALKKFKDDDPGDWKMAPSRDFTGHGVDIKEILDKPSHTLLPG